MPHGDRIRRVGLDAHIHTMLTQRQMPHFVYRAYDADGVLLYVGCTFNPHARFTGHKSQSAWYPLAVRCEWAIHPNFTEARRAEKRAIRTESPLYNVPPLESARRAAETRRRKLEQAAS